ncbi:hypothetical protein, partial [Chryseobacterium mucoviscidosis]|uniref:hypothetical protein n=1 Tax=Chryseobacterium mucoviscidosis TaxID=1945581 RepID=UPI001E625749
FFFALYFPPPNKKNFFFFKKNPPPLARVCFFFLGGGGGGPPPRNSKIASAKSGKQLLKNLFKIYEHPQSLSHPFLLELNFFGAKFFFNILNKE